MENQTRMRQARIIFIFVVPSLLYQVGVCQNIPGEQKPIPGLEENYLAELQKSKAGVEQVELLLKLTAYYIYPSDFKRKDFEKALSYGKQARKLSTNLKYQDGINEAQILIANTYLESGRDSLGRLLLDSTLTDLTKLREEIRNHGKPEREIRVLRQLSSIHQLLGQHQPAEFALLEIVNIFQSNGYPKVHYTYERLFSLAFSQAKLDKSLEYALATIKSMKLSGDSVCAGIFYYNLARIYAEVGQFQKGLDYYDAAFNFFKVHKSPYLYDIFDGKTWMMLKMKRHAEVIAETKEFSKKYPPESSAEMKLLELIQGGSYRMLKQYELAEPHYLRIIELQKKDNSTEAWVYKHVGQFYAEWGKFDKARPYLEAVFRLGKPNAHLHFLMYMVDSAQGNYQSAMRHLLENKKLDDSMYYATKTRAIQEMQVKYETDMKDRDLALLKQERLLQQAKIQQATTTRNMFIAGASMLILMLILVYSRYLLKQRANQEMNKKNLMLEHLVKEKEWLLKEVHHRVKNNLQTVLSLLESQARQLSNEALDAIHESQNRVYAMSLIHKKLYQSNDVSAINMEDYLRDLVQHLRDSFGSSVSIRFSLQLDSVDLDVSQVVPIGLIVNEAVTNSIKYAFPNRHHDNEINVTLARAYGDRILLVISDNGVGIHEPTLSTESLGVKLMRGLTEDIEGTFIIESKAGVTIRIEFAATKPFQRPTETVAQAFAHQPALH